MNNGGVGINLLWKCQSDIWPGYAQSQVNSISRRKSSWDFIIYSRATPTFPIVMYRSSLFLFLLPIHYKVNKGRGTTVNDIVRPLFPFTWDYIWLLCTLWSYVWVAFPKLIDIDPPNVGLGLENGWGLDAPAHPSTTILWPRVTCFKEDGKVLVFQRSRVTMFVWKATIWTSTILQVSISTCRDLPCVFPHRITLNFYFGLVFIYATKISFAHHGMPYIFLGVLSVDILLHVLACMVRKLWSGNW